MIAAANAAVSRHFFDAVGTEGDAGELAALATPGSPTPVTLDEPIPACSSFNCRPTSPALCQRSSGAFARQVTTMPSSAGGDSGWRAEGAAGGSLRIAAMTLA